MLDNDSYNATSHDKYKIRLCKNVTSCLLLLHFPPLTCSTSPATTTVREPITPQLSSSAAVAANDHHEVLHSTVTPAFATGDKTARIISDHATINSLTNKSEFLVTLSKRTPLTAVSQKIHTCADLQRLFHSHVEISIQNQNRYICDPTAD